MSPCIKLSLRRWTIYNSYLTKDKATYQNAIMRQPLPLIRQREKASHKNWLLIRMREITYAHSDPCIDYERRHNYLLPPAGSLFFPIWSKGLKKWFCIAHFWVLLLQCLLWTHKKGRIIMVNKTPTKVQNTTWSLEERQMVMIQAQMGT